MNQKKLLFFLGIILLVIGSIGLFLFGLTMFEGTAFGTWLQPYLDSPFLDIVEPIYIIGGLPLSVLTFLSVHYSNNDNSTRKGGGTGSTGGTEGKIIPNFAIALLKGIINLDKLERSLEKKHEELTRETGKKGDGEQGTGT